MKDIIKNIFIDWLNGPANIYRMADNNVYKNIIIKDLWHFSLNPYLKTEADIQMKFGGYLEQRVLNLEKNLTVHAELNVYRKNKRWWADLSVHDVSSGELWTGNNPNPITETVKGVIEIKYANYKYPDFHFDRGFIQGDLDKLASLSENIDKFMLIIDEGNRINNKHIEELLEICDQNKITVLSNNPNIMRYLIESSPSIES